jgi:glycosyltransferase involved in cell wall biosynthesis
VRVLASERNLGMVRSTMWLYEACRGEYIAWLDGDDYWISADKLQRQVDFLDAHREYTLCYHDSLVLEPDGTFRRHSLATPGQTTYTIEDLLVGPLGFAGSCLYRKVLAGFPEWFERLPYSDWPLQLLHAERGLAGWLPGILSAYRASGTSEAALGYDPRTHRTIYDFWAGRQAVVYDTFNRHLGFRYDGVIRTELLKIGPQGQRVYHVTPRWSRVRSVTWRLIRRRPALARAALAVAGWLAAIASWFCGRRVSSGGT